MPGPVLQAHSPRAVARSGAIFTVALVVCSVDRNGPLEGEPAFSPPPQCLQPANRPIVKHAYQPRTRARRLARCETAKVTFMFASNKADGDLRIQDFMNKAFLWYCKAMESTEDHFRYYYTPLTDGPTGPKVIDLQHQGERAIAMEYLSGRGGRNASSSGARGAQRRAAKPHPIIVFSLDSRDDKGCRF